MSVEWVDCTGMFYAEIGVASDTDKSPWPSLVRIETDGGEITSEDARALAAAIVAAAHDADADTERRRASK